FCHSSPLKVPGPYRALLSHLGELKNLGVLGLVRVLCTCVDLELLDLLGCETVVREHSLDSLLNCTLGELREKLLVRHGAQATRVTRVMVSELLLKLVAGQADLLGVNNDDVVTKI